MKICIPTNDDRGLESEASMHFGHAPFFILADVESAGLEVLRNPECHDHHGSCHHVQLLKAHAVDAVVCPGIGRQAASGLREAGIDVFVPAERTVSEIVNAVNAGKAHRLSIDDACGGGHHGHRHGAGTGAGHGHGQGQGRGSRHGRRAATTPAPGD